MIFSHVLYQLSYLGTPGRDWWKGSPVYHPLVELLGRGVEVRADVVERVLSFPTHLLRRFGRPAGLTVVGTVAAGYVAFLVRRARRPSVPRMSDEWLRSHDWYADYERWREY